MLCSRDRGRELNFDVTDRAAVDAARAFLCGVSPTAPHVFLLASLAMAATALAATFLPAARAGRVDPMLALRA